MFFFMPFFTNPYFTSNELMYPYNPTRNIRNECDGVSEQPNPTKYYFLNYCYKNNCKCFVCLKPLPSSDTIQPPGEGLPPPSNWYNIKKITGKPESFTITVESLLLPVNISSNEILAVKILFSPLILFWSSQRGDNFTTATSQGKNDALAAKYQPIRVEGYIFPYEAPGTVPLKLYWSSTRGDNFTTATSQGEKDALAAGYKFVRVEGYIFPNHIPGTVPLKLFWSSNRNDNFTTATAQGEKDALTAGYKFIRNEGYILPH
ncbi:hypothetical protein [Clostridium rectalis]|uniref:hypothetical protein n=1 Tax=Clostridium rectalis TaxID=2040295 RepID=UPI000F63FA82|nr:hypothetical protein [Clostridium rectalis]